MTDILTKLAALTAKDDASPVPACPFCGSLKGSNKHDDGRHWWHCDSCYATGPLTSRYSDPENGDAVWETRPREAALTALVQAAAKEIERIKAAIRPLQKRLQAIGHDYEELMALERALTPQEPTS